MKKNPPVVLTIAGSDNSCGAGAQADLKTITALGGYAQTAITCVVAEVPGHVSAIQAVRAAIVAEQIRLSFEAFPVAAIKTGMLYSTSIIRAVASELSGLKKCPPLVVDPVMVASSGDPLLKTSAIEAYREWIFPLATLVTPNLDEAARLVGRKLRNPEQAKEAARELATKWKVPFLVKGGHLMLAKAEDYLAWPNGKLKTFSAIRCKGVETHGTGCTYSAAICAGLAKGLSLESSVGAGKRFITRAIQRHLRLGRYTPLNHLSA